MANKDEGIHTIRPGGGAVHKPSEGSNGRDRSKEKEDDKPRVRTGTIVADEKNETRVTGERDKMDTKSYYRYTVLPNLGKLVERLDSDEDRAHYEEVLTGLEEVLNIDSDEVNKAAHKEALKALEEKGDRSTAYNVLSYYNNQTIKSLAILANYSAEPGYKPFSGSPEQERALLIYSEFLLHNFRMSSTNPDVIASAGSFEIREQVDKLHIDEDRKAALVQALDKMSHFADYSFVDVAKGIYIGRASYGAPDDPDADEPEHLDAKQVRDILRVYNNQTEGAHRALISALDAVDPESLQLWRTYRENGIEVDLNERPFSAWDKQIAERNKAQLDENGHVPSKYYINGILGTEKTTVGRWGRHDPHQLKHTVKTKVEQAPVMRNGHEVLEDVETVTIAIMAGVYQGEFKEGRTLQPGESRPKEFFEKVVDVQVWGAQLNSADKVENFMDQLKAAEGVVMRGAEVVKVLGNFEYERTQDPQIAKAEHFRIPVINYQGKPDYLIVDRKTLLEMEKSTHKAQQSFARLGEADSRYKVSPREERQARFNAQLRQNENTPEAWVDQERDFLTVEGIANEKMEALRARRGRRAEGEDDPQAAKISEALKNYQTLVNEFNLNYCRISRYRVLAEERLAGMHVRRASPDYLTRLRQEMNSVAVEYLNMVSAFRTVNAEIIRMSSTKDMEKELENLLANMDIEMQVQMKLQSTNKTEEEIRAEYGSSVRRNNGRAPGAESLSLRQRLASIRRRPEAVATIAAEEAEEVPDTGEAMSLTPAEAEGTTLPEIVGRAQSFTIEYHDPQYRFMRNGVEIADHDDPIFTVNSSVYRELQFTSYEVTKDDPNSSRIAFVPLERLGTLPENIKAGFRPGSTAVSFEFILEHSDSSMRGNDSVILTGAMVLSKTDAEALERGIVANPDMFNDMVVAVNGGNPIPTYLKNPDGSPVPGSLTAKRKGTRVSMYHMDDEGHPLMSQTGEFGSTS